MFTQTINNIKLTLKIQTKAELYIIILILKHWHTNVKSIVEIMTQEYSL